MSGAKFTPDFRNVSVLYLASNNVQHLPLAKYFQADTDRTARYAVGIGLLQVSHRFLIPSRISNSVKFWAARKPGITHTLL